MFYVNKLYDIIIKSQINFTLNLLQTEERFQSQVHPHVEKTQRETQSGQLRTPVGIPLLDRIQLYH